MKERDQALTQLLAAALVIELTPRIRTFLEQHDPKALEQLQVATRNARRMARSARGRARLEWLVKQIEQQKAWIQECGGHLQGYIARYGAAADPDHYGNGGEAIYQADTNELKRLQAELDAEIGE
jgi:hypothetical protein